jgi:hypothetical protein
MKRVVILILTLTFLAVLYYAYTTTANCSVDVTKKEGFTSAAPTRASDCNCLPGYIPSKGAGGQYGGNILTWTGATGHKYYYYNPSGTNDVYHISSDNKCGLPTSGDFMSVTHSDLFSNKKYKYTWQKSACDVVNENKNKEGMFFCQRLGDPSSRRECY